MRPAPSGSAVLASAFAGFRFPPEVMTPAVRWYLRFGLSYRDVEELLTERGIDVDHLSVYRWVQRFTPLFADAARPCRRAVCDRWHVGETNLRVSGSWGYLYRALDQFGQVVDVFLSAHRDARAARRFFAHAIRTTRTEPAEVVTTVRARTLSILDELLPGSVHDVEQYANSVLEADHRRLKSRLRPMRGLKTEGNAQIIALGHAFGQNLRRGTTSSAWTSPAKQRLTRAFAEMAVTI
jgi:transposase-like protein